MRRTDDFVKNIYTAALLLLPWSVAAQQQCPVFTAQPSSARQCVATDAVLTVQIAGAAERLYWEYHNGTDWVPAVEGVNAALTGDWSGTTTNQLTVKVTATDDAAKYNNLPVRCVALSTNNKCGAGGKIHSSAAGIIFNKTVTMVPPSGRAICKDTPLDLVVIASGGGPYKYTWKQDGFTVGGDSAVFLLKKVTTINEGKYTVTVENACGQVESQPFGVTVVETTPPGFVPGNTSSPPDYGGQPAPYKGCDGGGAFFKVATTGDVGGYQWQYQPVDGDLTDLSETSFNAMGVQVTGSKTPELHLTNLKIALSGYKFKCKISGTCTAAAGVSAEATLTVFAIPQITRPLSDKIICLNSNLELSVTVKEGGVNSTFDYRWTHLEKPNTVSERLNLQANTDVFSKPGIKRYQAGAYQVTISNVCGTASSTANIKVNSPPDLGGNPGPNVTVTEDICSLVDYKPTVTVDAGKPDNGPYKISWIRNTLPYGKAGGDSEAPNAILNNPEARLLNVVSVPSGVAYSLRKLRSEYSGPAVRVRRADGATMDIGFDAKGAFDAATAVSFLNIDRPPASRGFIEKWYDQGPKKWDAVQGEGHLRPELICTSGVSKSYTFNTLLAADPPTWMPWTTVNIPANDEFEFSRLQSNNFSATTAPRFMPMGSNYTITEFNNNGTAITFQVEFLDGPIIKCHELQIEPIEPIGRGSTGKLKLTVLLSGFVDTNVQTAKSTIPIGDLSAKLNQPTPPPGFVRQINREVYGVNLVLTTTSGTSNAEIKFDGNDFLETQKGVHLLTKAPDKPEGSVWMVAKTGDQSPHAVFGVDAPGTVWKGNPNDGGSAKFNVMGIEPAKEVTGDAAAWRQYEFMNGDPNGGNNGSVKVGFNYFNQKTGGTATGTPSLTAPEFTIGKANGASAGKACSMKEFIMYPQALSDRDKSTVDISQMAYFNTYTGDIEAAGDLNLACDYNYQGGITKLRFAGILDASCAPYSVLPKLQAGSWRNATLIRPFIPTDLSTQLKQWIDFSDESKMTFDSPLSAQFKTFNSIQDKASGNNANRYYNDAGQVYSPRFANDRMESWDASFQGKQLKTDYKLRNKDEAGNGVGWAFFFTAGYMEGGRQQRIFDGKTIPENNTLFGFHWEGEGGIYINPNAAVVRRAVSKDALMHVWSARCLPVSGLNLIQDWDKLTQLRFAFSNPDWSESMSINFGKYKSGEWTDNYAVKEVIATEGTLSDADYEKLKGYIAWHAGLQANLPSSHVYANQRPLTTLPVGSSLIFVANVENACNTGNPVTKTLTVNVGNRCADAVIPDSGQPQNQKICATGTAAFTVKAQNATAYTWQYSENNSDWNDFAIVPVAQFTPQAQNVMNTVLPDYNNDGWRTDGNFLLGSSVTVDNAVAAVEIGAVVHSGQTIRATRMGVWDQNNVLLAEATLTGNDVGRAANSTRISNIDHPFEIVYAKLSPPVQLNPGITYYVARQLLPLNGSNEHFLQLSNSSISIATPAGAGYGFNFGSAYYRENPTDPSFSKPTNRSGINGWFTTNLKVAPIQNINTPGFGTTAHSGVFTNTLNVSNIDLSVNPSGRYYRCKVSGGSSNNLYSKSVELIVNTEALSLPISSDALLADSYQVCSGSALNLKFSLKTSEVNNKTRAVGGGPVTFIWTKATISNRVELSSKEVRRVTKADTIPSDIYVETGITGDDPATPGEDSKLSYRYKVTARNACSPEKSSSTIVKVSLKIPVITDRPKDATYCIHSETASPKVIMSVASNPPPVTYTWQRLNTAYGRWEDVNANSVTTGQDKATLTFDKPSRLSYDQSHYRCVLKNACGETASNPAALLVRGNVPSITIQPSDLSLCTAGVTGVMALGAFHVKVSESQGYSWMRVNGNEETPLTDNSGAWSGSSTDKLIFYPEAANHPSLNGTKYRCKLVDNCPQSDPPFIKTDPVTLSFTAEAPSPATLAHIPDQNLCSGEMTAEITFAGTHVLNYLWMNNSNPETGLPANGNLGAIPPFETFNVTNREVTDTITVIPVNGACIGSKHTVATAGGSGTGNTRSHTAGDAVTLITVHPKPTMTADILNTSVCSAVGGDKNVKFDLSNRWLQVARTHFNWEVSQSVSGTANEPAVRASGDAANGTPAGGIPEAPADSGTASKEGQLINTSPAPIDVHYKFFPSYDILNANPAKTCIGDWVEKMITVKPRPTVAKPPNQPANPAVKQALCDGEPAAGVTFTSPSDTRVANTVYNWSNNNISIGLPQSGSGNIAGFNVKNATRGLQTATITVTPSAGGCLGTPVDFEITTAPKPAMQVIRYEPVICSGSSPKIQMTSAPRNVDNTAFSWNVQTVAGVTGPGADNYVSPVPNPAAHTDTGTEQSMNGELNNSTNAVQNVDYTFTPSAFGCLGEAVKTNVKVNPVPTVEVPATNEICSKQTTRIPLKSATDVANTFFIWTVDNSNGASDQPIGSPGPIEQTLSIDDDAFTTASVVYHITPQANGCKGNAVQSTVNINPLPFVTATVNPDRTCTGLETNVTLSSRPPNAKFAWDLERINVTGGMAQAQPVAVAAIRQVFTVAGKLNGTVNFLVSAVSDKGCNSSNKASAQVTIDRGPGTVAPISDKIFCDDGATELAGDIELGEGDITLQWQESQDRGTTWRNLTEGPPYSGISTRRLLINPTPSSYTGYLYRLSLDDKVCPTVFSSTPAITATFANVGTAYSPESQINYGDKVTFGFTNPPPFTTYKWDFGDGWTSNLDSPEHFYYPAAGVEGPYHVTVEAFANNYECKKKFDVANITMSRPKESGGDLFTGSNPDTGAWAWPSPFRDQLNVKCRDMEGLELIDMQGRIVWHTNPAADQTTLQTDFLASGLYILRIWNKQADYKIKVTKQ